MIPKQFRYDPSAVQGSGCPISIVTGARTYGKTYAWKKVGIKNYINNGNTWVLLRTYESELMDVIHSSEGFFSDIERNNEFPGYQFQVHGKMMQIKHGEKDKWHNLGQFMALTKYGSYKGAALAKCSLIVFDEFIRENKFPGYPTDAVNALYSIWESLDRQEGRTKIVMLANSADLVNPYFLAWNIEPPEKGTSHIYKVGESRLFYQNCYDPKFDKYSKQSEIRKFTSGTKYDSYAHDNDFKNMTGLFVKHKPKTSHPQATIIFRNDAYTIWPDGVSGDIYVCKAHNETNVLKIALTRNDMKPDIMLIKRNSSYIKTLLNAFQVSQLYFDSDATRERFLDALSLCGLR